MDQLCTDLNAMKVTQEELVEEIKSLRWSQDATTNFLSDKKMIARTKTDFKTKYQVVIPLATYDNFVMCQEKLNNDQFFKKDVVRINFINCYY